MTAIFYLATKCRGCGAPFIKDGKHIAIQLIDLGIQAVITFKKTPEEKDDFGPLNLIICPQCSLVQLSDTVEKDRMFRDYHYLSGVNSSMRTSLLDIVKQAESLVSLQPGDLVLDIGSNDNTLLSCYRSFVGKAGFEPAYNLRKKDNVLTDPPYYIINGYFDAERYFMVFNQKAKIVTAIAMFYDLEDANKFCADVKKVLHEDGIFIIQMNYLGAMIKNLTIDNISHEHLCFYSLSTLEPILNRNALYVDDVKFNDVNGGSIRIVARHWPKDMKWNVVKANESDLSEIETFIEWARQLNKIRADLRTYILTEKAAGKTIWGYGASTRGNTLLQWLGFDSSIIEKIADRNPLKHGKFTAGGNIPIVSEEEMRAAQPDNLFILAYSFRKEFLERESEYLRAGGSMLFPLPKPEIVTQWTSRFL